MTDDASITALDRATAGRVLLPGSDDYEQARRVFNAMVDRRPTAIVRCTAPADVIAAVNHAREAGLPLSVRGGGHSVSGSAVCDGGIMVDLSFMKGLRVDPITSVAEAQPGLTLGEFDAGTQAFGLATMTGVVSMTGLAGLTLGGGIGWLNGRHGLACDNLIGAGLVIATGELVTVRRGQHNDLLWALRGAGSNYGVVTSMRMTLHPVTKVLAGSVTFPASRAADALRFYQDFTRHTPDELTTAASVWLDADRQPTVSVAVCWCGSIESGEQALRPLRSFGPPLQDAISPINYTALQSASDSGYPPWRLRYWKASFLRELSPEAIEAILDCAVENAFDLQRDRDAGNLPNRSPGAPSRQRLPASGPPLGLPHPLPVGRADRLRPQHRVDPTALRAHGTVLESGVYANNLGEDDIERVASAYGPNYGRLATIKRTWDPDNLFRLNHNIVPATSTA